jgi:16S rRNA (cytosine967-C5)-methyltransferase
VKAFLDFGRGLPLREAPPAWVGTESGRRLYAQLLRGLVRHKRYLEEEAARLGGAGPRHLDRVVLAVAMLGLLQLRMLSGIPAHAALHESVELVSRLGYRRAKAWVNGVLRAALRELEAGLADPSALPLAVRTSHPDWMIERWRARYGEACCAAICEANNRFVGVTVRVEPGTEAREALIASLREEGLAAEPHPLWAGAIVVEQTAALLQSPHFREGRLYVQDAASQLLTAWTAPLWRGPVLDACAAPGGKLTHLLRLAQPSPRLIGADRHAARMARIRENLGRLRMATPSLILADAARPPFRPASLDAVLLDVPCLSTGMIRKHPEIKWRKRPEDLAALTARQAAMLDGAAEALRPGGSLLYSTCSLEPEENEEQVARFLGRRTDFARVPFREIPPPEGFTGDPAALLTADGDFQALPGDAWMGLYAAMLRKVK